jgi:hypothetical protein
MPVEASATIESVMLQNHVLLSSRGVATLILHDSASIDLCLSHVEERLAALNTTGPEFYREASISSAGLKRNSDANKRRKRIERFGKAQRAGGRSSLDDLA